MKLITSGLGDAVCYPSAVICSCRTRRDLEMLIRVCSWQLFSHPGCAAGLEDRKGMGLSRDLRI